MIFEKYIDTNEILIVSGFLGEGKTTFIKEQGENPVSQCVFIGKYIQSDMIGIRTGKFRLKLGL